jgi:hypothetical protein
VRRAHAEERLRRDHEGPQVKAPFTARNPGFVDRHKLIDCLQEQSLRHFRQGHPHRGGAEASCILVGPEQRDAAVLQGIGFETLEDFLPVVQHGGRGIEGDRLAGAHLRVVPATVLGPADGHHMVGEDTAETGVLQEFGAGGGCDGLARRLTGKGEGVDLRMGVHRSGPASPKPPALCLASHLWGILLTRPAHLRLPDQGLDRRGASAHDRFV